ncbi:MAG: dicarboxylate/amino acid:cation symporter [Chlamydiota bacterium]|nr:dicarboxylate/amino acid:cation symporter [Chlamydiota bacterium]
MKTLLALALGATMGMLLGQNHPDVTILSNRLGGAFIDLLKMLVGLIVFSSLVTGICHISHPSTLIRVGSKTLFFYFITTIAGITFGIVTASLFLPGASLNLSLPPSLPPFHSNTLMDFLFNAIPSNPFAAFVNGNILQIILFASFFSIGINLSGERGQRILPYFESLGEIMHNLTHMIMKIAPYGIFFLMASAISSIGGKIVLPLLQLLLCNFLACLLHVAFIFCGTIRYIIRLPLVPFFRGMQEAIALAFSTSSSAATLPISIECAKERLGLCPDLSGFILSLGATINMNGAAIGQAISALFIAQAYGIEISVLKIAILYVVSLVSAIGAAGVPGTGILMLSIVLQSMGLPIEGIILIAGVDRLREMVSSVINVLGDALAALYISKKEGKVNISYYATNGGTT